MQISSTGLIIRPLQHRDLKGIAQLHEIVSEQEFLLEQWLSLAQLANWFPPPWQNSARAYVAESGGQLFGYILVSPVNESGSTWCVDQVVIAPGGHQALGSQLIRHCLECCWEARMWLTEIDTRSIDTIALYRQNGFQPLAHLTDWQVSSAALAALSEDAPDLPNLFPVSNTDAPLLYQLENAAMPPQIRQVYDWGVQDFRVNPLLKLLHYGKLVFSHQQEITGYVYECQRKAAIGFFCLLLQRRSEESAACHQLKLTVHPAYTWLYPELMTQIARIIDRHRTIAHDRLVLTSADYQPEREDYLEKSGAERKSHRLLMARSVWHKLRETKPVLDALQLSRMLSGLQPSQKPVPGRIDTKPE